jgi:hypothetical protein
MRSFFKNSEKKSKSICGMPEKAENVKDHYRYAAPGRIFALLLFLKIFFDTATCGA